MKMNRRMMLVSGLLSLLAACGGQGSGETSTSSMAPAPLALSYSASVPLGGNAFVTASSANASEIIGDGGLGNWTNANTVTSVYFRAAQAGSLNLGLVARLAGATSSKVKVTVNGAVFNVNLSGSSSKTYDIGTVNIPAAGYVKVDIQGVSKVGSYFGDVSVIKIGGTASTNAKFANDAANYYWSRRGPSVHAGYTTPANTEYFYNEITVPVGQDSIGSYFMSNGFNGGYAGMQVKSTTERWILFSVWDGDAGGKTTLVRKGPNVVDNSFGGEGTGGQTYMVFNWQAGTTYKFLTRAQPDGAGNTSYSAWFFTPETAAWRFVATWKRPGTNNSYLTGNHSFLENFIDTNGYLGRKVLLGNQWARSNTGVWAEATQMYFTGDATVTNQQRMDYAGGVENGKFYLRNGAFFANYVPVNQSFNRTATGVAPNINFAALP